MAVEIKWSRKREEKCHRHRNQSRNRKWHNILKDQYKDTESDQQQGQKVMENYHTLSLTSQVKGIISTAKIFYILHWETSHRAEKGIRHRISLTTHPKVSDQFYFPVFSWLYESGSRQKTMLSEPGQTKTAQGYPADKCDALCLKISGPEHKEKIKI